MLDKVAYCIPVFTDYSLYGPDSIEDAGIILSGCTGSEDCHKIEAIVQNEVDDNIESGNKVNCTSNVKSDTNTMSNEVSVLSQPTKKNQTQNITFYKTYTTDNNYGPNEFVQSENSDSLPTHKSSDDNVELISTEHNDNVGFGIADDVIYEDMPGILILYIVNDEGMSHNIEVENAVRVSGDEVTLDLNKAVQALADFINREDLSLEDSMEWTEDTEPEEPQRIVEDGYIFYDMGESA
jgi:hypothetical protein